jgi:hypothetical protein
LVAALLCPPAGDHIACRGVYAVAHGGVAASVRPLRCGGSGAKMRVTLFIYPQECFSRSRISLYGRGWKLCARTDFMT